MEGGGCCARAAAEAVPYEEDPGFSWRRLVLLVVGCAAVAVAFVVAEVRAICPNPNPDPNPTLALTLALTLTITQQKRRCMML